MRPALGALLLAGCTCHLKGGPIEPRPGESSADLDGDGFEAPEDCDDEDPLVYPGAPDAPLDTMDADCDGSQGSAWRAEGLRVDESFGAALAWTSRESLLVGAPHGDPGRLYEAFPDHIEILLQGTGRDLLGSSVAVSERGRVVVGAPWRGEQAGVVLDETGAIRAIGQPGDRLGGRLAARGRDWAATTVSGLRMGASPRALPGRPGSLAILADGEVIVGLPFSETALGATRRSIAAPTGAPAEAGASLAVGDLDGDGQEDLATGAPSGARVYLVLGSDWPDSLDDALVVQGEGGRFGHAVALGDLDGDGVLDLVVGAPMAGDAMNGALFAFAGPFTRSLTLDDAFWQIAGREGDQLGTTLAVGPQGLAAGAPGGALHRGAVEVWGD